MNLKSYILNPKSLINHKGSSLVEVLLSATLLGMIVIALTGMLIYGQESSSLAGGRSKAALLAEEGLEAVRAIKESSYANLTNGTKGLAVSAGAWTFSGTSDTTDTTFNRVITITDAGTNRKQVISTVTWQQNLQRAGSVVLTTYLNNWTISAGNWALPLIDAAFDLTLANSGDASVDGRTIAFANNKVYLGRNNGASREFYIIDVSTPASPVILGQRELAGNPNDIVIRGNYAYIASSDDTTELQIVDISDPATVANTGKLTTVDLTVANSNNATADAIALAINGNYLIMVRNAGDQFLIFDLTNPASPGNPVGRTATITGVSTDVASSGNYAYVSSTDNAAEFQVINITTKTTPARIGLLDLNSGNAGSDALSVEMAGNYVLVGRSSTAAPDLYSVLITTPASPTLAGTLDIGGDVRSIAYDSGGGYAFLATGDATTEFKVINAQSLTSLTIMGSLNLNTSALKVVYDPVLNRAFMASTDNTQELLVIEPS